MAREFGRIGQQIGQHLNDPSRVGHDGKLLGVRLELERDGLGIESTRTDLDRLMSGVYQVARLLLELDLADQHTVHFEQVVNQPGQMTRLPFDDVARSGETGRKVRLLQDVGCTEDGGYRVAQLVGEHGQKAGLLEIDLLEHVAVDFELLRTLCELLRRGIAFTFGIFRVALRRDAEAPVHDRKDDGSGGADVCAT